jgi:hypothetical protein
VSHDGVVVCADARVELLKEHHGAAFSCLPNCSEVEEQRVPFRPSVSDLRVVSNLQQASAQHEKVNNNSDHDAYVTCADTSGICNRYDAP